LGFEGVVITDDLEMGAVARQYSPEAAALAALKAGGDLLLVCNDLEKMHRTAEAVRDGLQRGLLDTDSLAASLARVDRIREKFLDPFRLSDISEVTNYFST
jgi:beta-N-acetylhexosaminidase